KSLDLLAGGSGIAIARGADGTRKIEIGLGKPKAIPGKSSWVQRKRGCLVPAASFERIASWYRRPRISRLEYFLVNLADGANLIQNAFGLLILCALQVSIYQVVQRVKLILRSRSGIYLCHDFPGGGSRCEVRLN